MCVCLFLLELYGSKYSFGVLVYAVHITRTLCLEAGTFANSGLCVFADKELRFNIHFASVLAMTFASIAAVVY